MKWLLALAIALVLASAVSAQQHILFVDTIYPSATNEIVLDKGVVTDTLNVEGEIRVYRIESGPGEGSGSDPNLELNFPSLDFEAQYHLFQTEQNVILEATEGDAKLSAGSDIVSVATQLFASSQEGGTDIISHHVNWSAEGWAEVRGQGNEFDINGGGLHLSSEAADIALSFGGTMETKGGGDFVIQSERSASLLTDDGDLVLTAVADQSVRLAGGELFSIDSKTAFNLNGEDISLVGSEGLNLASGGKTSFSTEGEARFRSNGDILFFGGPEEESSITAGDFTATMQQGFLLDSVAGTFQVTADAALSFATTAPNARISFFSGEDLTSSFTNSITTTASSILIGNSNSLSAQVKIGDGDLTADATFSGDAGVFVDAQQWIVNGDDILLDSDNRVNLSAGFSASVAGTTTLDVSAGDWIKVRGANQIYTTEENGDITLTGQPLSIHQQSGDSDAKLHIDANTILFDSTDDPLDFDGGNFFASAGGDLSITSESNINMKVDQELVMKSQQSVTYDLETLNTDGFYLYSTTSTSITADDVDIAAPLGSIDLSSPVISVDSGGQGFILISTGDGLGVRLLSENCGSDPFCARNLREYVKFSAGTSMTFSATAGTFSLRGEEDFSVSATDHAILVDASTGMEVTVDSTRSFGNDGSISFTTTSAEDGTDFFKVQTAGNQLWTLSGDSTLDATQQVSVLTDTFSLLGGDLTSDNLGEAVTLSSLNSNINLGDNGGDPDTDAISLSGSDFTASASGEGAQITLSSAGGVSFTANDRGGHFTAAGPASFQSTTTTTLTTDRSIRYTANGGTGFTHTTTSLTATGSDSVVMGSSGTGSATFSSKGAQSLQSGGNINISAWDGPVSINGDISFTNTNGFDLDADSFVVSGPSHSFKSETGTVKFYSKTLLDIEASSNLDITSNALQGTGGNIYVSSGSSQYIQILAAGDVSLHSQECPIYARPWGNSADMTWTSQRDIIFKGDSQVAILFDAWQGLTIDANDEDSSTGFLKLNSATLTVSTEDGYDVAFLPKGQLSFLATAGPLALDSGRDTEIVAGAVVSLAAGQVNPGSISWTVSRGDLDWRSGRNIRVSTASADGAIQVQSTVNNIEMESRHDIIVTADGVMSFLSTGSASSRAMGDVWGAGHFNTVPSHSTAHSLPSIDPLTGNFVFPEQKPVTGISLQTTDPLGNIFLDADTGGLQLSAEDDIVAASYRHFSIQANTEVDMDSDENASLVSPDGMVSWRARDGVTVTGNGQIQATASRDGVISSEDEIAISAPTLSVTTNGGDLLLQTADLGDSSDITLTSAADAAFSFTAQDGFFLRAATGFSVAATSATYSGGCGVYFSTTAGPISMNGGNTLTAFAHEDLELAAGLDMSLSAQGISWTAQEFTQFLAVQDIHFTAASDITFSAAQGAIAVQSEGTEAGTTERDRVLLSSSGSSVALQANRDVIIESLSEVILGFETRPLIDVNAAGSPSNGIVMDVLGDVVWTHSAGDFSISGDVGTEFLSLGGQLYTTNGQLDVKATDVNAKLQVDGNNGVVLFQAITDFRVTGEATGSSASVTAATALDLTTTEGNIAVTGDTGKITMGAESMTYRFNSNIAFNSDTTISLFGRDMTFQNDPRETGELTVTHTSTLNYVLRSHLDMEAGTNLNVDAPSVNVAAGSNEFPVEFSSATSILIQGDDVTLTGEMTLETQTEFKLDAATGLSAQLEGEMALTTLGTMSFDSTTIDFSNTGQPGEINIVSRRDIIRSGAANTQLTMTAANEMKIHNNPDGLGTATFGFTAATTISTGGDNAPLQAQAANQMIFNAQATTFSAIATTNVDMTADTNLVFDSRGGLTFTFDTSASFSAGSQSHRDSILVQANLLDINGATLTVTHTPAEWADAGDIQLIGEPIVLTVTKDVLFMAQGEQDPTRPESGRLEFSAGSFENKAGGLNTINSAAGLEAHAATTLGFTGANIAIKATGMSPEGFGISFRSESNACSITASTSYVEEADQNIEFASLGGATSIAATTALFEIIGTNGFEGLHHNRMQFRSNADGGRILFQGTSMDMDFGDDFIVRSGNDISISSATTSTYVSQYITMQATGWERRDGASAVDAFVLGTGAKLGHSTIHLSAPAISSTAASSIALNSAHIGGGDVTIQTPPVITVATLSSPSSYLRTGSLRTQGIALAGTPANLFQSGIGSATGEMLIGDFNSVASASAKVTADNDISFKADRFYLRPSTGTGQRVHLVAEKGHILAYAYAPDATGRLDDNTNYNTWINAVGDFPRVDVIAPRELRHRQHRCLRFFDLTYPTINACDQSSAHPASRQSTTLAVGFANDNGDSFPEEYLYDDFCICPDGGGGLIGGCGCPNHAYRVEQLRLALVCYGLLRPIPTGNTAGLADVSDCNGTTVDCLVGDNY